MPSCRFRARHLPNLFLITGVLCILSGVRDYLAHPPPVHASQTNKPHFPASGRHLRSASSISSDPQPVSAIEQCKYASASTTFIADSHGFVCPRYHASTLTRCCIPTSPALRYSCKFCNSDSCCSLFEHCVSCCMKPTQTGPQQLHVSERHRQYTVQDDFELCSSLCRSSSRSVIHENAYRHEQHHCFGLNAPPLDNGLHGGVFNFASPVTPQ